MKKEPDQSLVSSGQWDFPLKITKKVNYLILALFKYQTILYSYIHIIGQF